ncbi:MAG: hypothetical protein GY827_08880 [Cytophagales bacterium]|nr:hypothetical protein [Cytophagales bacterium]
MENAMIIEKENLHLFSFSTSDVLKSDLMKAKRKLNIQKAVRLGNLYKGKVKIKFRNVKHELLSVHTTIWALGSDFISLKGGRAIPIKAIESIEF